MIEFKGNKEEASVHFIPNRLISTPFGSKQEITPSRERKAFIKGADWYEKNSKAPEMLEMLEEINELGYDFFNWDKLEQLIKNATEL